MEDILDLYAKAYDPMCPVICMDEQPYQLLDHITEPLPMKKGSCKKEDYEYERKGTCCIFMFTEPLSNWRHVNVRHRRTKMDWAEEIQELLDVHYPLAEKIILVMDNLNTHTISSLYERFSPAKARELVERLEIHYTPKHGSWLDIAEIELNVMTRQCLSRRISDIGTLQHQVNAWSKERNASQAKVVWQFKTGEARIKLKHLYPKLI